MITTLYSYYTLKNNIRIGVLFIIILICISLNTIGQIIEIKEQSVADNTKNECVPKELRTKIEAYLKPAFQQYAHAAKSVALEHPKMIFPLRKNPFAMDYDIFRIVNFVDLNSSVGSSGFNQYTSTNLDYNCGNRTYDMNNGYNHAGSDIMSYPFDWQKMKTGEVEVIAASPGIIIGKVDGNSSFSCGSNAASNNWNAVYVLHADNSVVWYGHLKEGSLTMKPVGSTVEEGEYIGIVGSSGFSSNPHLHFELHGANNQVIEPFFGSCNNTTIDSWWKNQLPYTDKKINHISTHILHPTVFQCPASNNKSRYSYYLRKNTTSHYYIWGKGLQSGDLMNFNIVRPNGTSMVNFNYNSSNTYNSFYFYWSIFVGASEPNGEYNLKFTFDNKLYERKFGIADQNTILTSIEYNSYCSGEVLSVDYSIGSGNYNAGNTFIAQLSDANGSFSAPTNIGSINATTDGVISAHLPSGIQSSNKYRIRVIATTGQNPVLDNGTDIYIKSIPSATISGNFAIVSGQTVNIPITLNGGGPYYANLSNSKGRTFDLSNAIFQDSPTQNTTYSILNIMNSCGVGTTSGSANVVITNCTQNLTLTNPIDNIDQGEVIHQASSINGKIQASNLISGTANVIYQAKSIELNPSFKAEMGTVFKAEIGGCN